MRQKLPCMWRKWSDFSPKVNDYHFAKFLSEILQKRPCLHHGLTDYKNYLGNENGGLKINKEKKWENTLETSETSYNINYTYIHYFVRDPIDPTFGVR